MTEYNHLKGLNPEEAKAFVTQYLSNLKQIDNDIRKTIEAIELWKGRKTLAEEKDRLDLLAGAQTELEHHQHKLASLKIARQELEKELAEIKEEMKEKSTESGRIMSPEETDFLLKKLEALGGDAERFRLNQSMKETEAELDLEELKRKMLDET
jgi:hypothetical protein